MNKIIHTFSTLLSLTYISCTNKPTKNEANLKDSLFKEYKQQVSKLHELNIDASGIFFLEAFEKSDLNEMQNILMQIKTEISLLKKWPFYDSCLNLTNIKNSTADETYGLVYYPSYCYNPIVITLTRFDKNYNLHFTLFENSKDSSCYKVSSDFNKKLTEKNWSDIQTHLILADIWGLKTSNDEKESLDGSCIIFSAFIKDTRYHHYKNNYCIVYRKEFSTLREFIDLTLKISGNTKGCYWVK